VGECFFWYRPTRVVPDQRPLNGRCCCCCNRPIKMIYRPAVTNEGLNQVFVQCVVCIGMQWLCISHTHTHTHPFNGPLSGTTWVSQKGKTSGDFMKQETVSGSGISWAICKSAHGPRQITTPAPHHSVFYRPDALPAVQLTVSKHRRLMAVYINSFA